MFFNIFMVLKLIMLILMFYIPRMERQMLRDVSNSRPSIKSNILYLTINFPKSLYF